MSAQTSCKSHTVDRNTVGGKVPIVPRRKVELLPEIRRRVETVNSEILLREPGLSKLDFFGRNVKTGLGTGPNILIGDKSEIRLLEAAERDPLEYRIVLLAGNNDRVVLAGLRCEAYEDYLEKLLGLERLNVMKIPPPQTGSPRPTAQRCLEDRATFEQLLAIVRSSNGVTLLPFMAAGSVWKLASQLANEAHGTVFVAGPPPNLTQRVNDKLWFADVAKTLLGIAATPPVYSAFGPAALVGHVRRLSQKWEKLVIKVPDSAGSLGNLPLYSDAIKNLSAKQLHRYLIEAMSHITRTDAYPLMVEVWDCNVLCSPSVQLWIPAKENGDPVIEGIYVQATEGAGGKFVGAKPADLPPDHDRQICMEAVALGLLFQKLGYFGRCSLDAVLTGTGDKVAQLHWIECNGRWGGVSLPMTFVNRMFAPDRTPAYVIWQRSHLDFPATPFSEALVRLSDLLFEQRGEPRGIVITSPTGIETGTGLQLIAFGNSEGDATDLANEALRRMTET